MWSATDMDAWSAFAVGPHLSSAKIALWGGGGGGYFKSEGTIRLPKKICKVGETSTCVQFLLGFWLIYDIVILPPDQNTHSQSTGVKCGFPAGEVRFSQVTINLCDGHQESKHSIGPPLRCPINF